MNQAGRPLLVVALVSALTLSCSKGGTPTKPPEQNAGDVEVLSTPAGAAILLDGVSTSKTTPDTLLDVTAGSRVIGLRLTNYADTSITSTVASGALARVNVVLRHLQTYVPPAIQLESHPMSVAGTIGAIASADFNSDGHLDLVVTSVVAPTSRVLLLTGGGDGSFASTATVVDTTATIWGMTAGDFDDDGKADVACLVETYGNADLLLFLGNGNGTFQRGGIAHFAYAPASAQVSALRAGDLDGDGAADLFIGYQTGTTVAALGVWLANGIGGLQPMVEYTKGFSSEEILGVSDMSLADFNGDGITDVAQGLYGLQYHLGGIILWRGVGGGALGSSPTFIEAMGYSSGVAAGDFNRDGRTDLATADTGGSQANGAAEVFLGKGDGTFQAPISYATGMYSVAVVAADFNADQRPDLAVINNFSSTVSILAGYGDGVFTAEGSFATSGGGARVAAGDFDGNSRPDLAITNSLNASPSTLNILLSK